MPCPSEIALSPEAAGAGAVVLASAFADTLGDAEDAAGVTDGEIDVVGDEETTFGEAVCSAKEPTEEGADTSEITGDTLADGEADADTLKAASAEAFFE